MKYKTWVIVFISAVILAACSSNETEKEVETDIESENKLENEGIETENLESEVEEDSGTEDDLETETEEDTGAENETIETSSEEESGSVYENSSSQNIDAEFIMENIKIGMTESEILELLGEPDVTGVDGMYYADPVWRYDIGAQEGYYFDDYEQYDSDYAERYDKHDEVGVVDLDGIRNKELDIQLFINWLENKVDTVSHTYIRDGQLVSHFLLSDGTRKEDIHQ